MPGLIRRLSAFGFLLLLASTVSAQTVCVDTMGKLRLALQAFHLGNPTVIHLVQGTYKVDNASGDTLGRFGLNASGVGIQVIGGYTANCASRVLDPANTVIDGQNQPNSMLGLSADGDILVMGVTVTRMSGSQSALELTHASEDASAHSLTMKYCRVVNNNATYQQLMLSAVGAGETSARTIAWNNLVANNPSGAKAVYVQFTAAAVIDFTNNTVANNGGTPTFGIAYGSGSNATVRIVDNIFWANSNLDLDVASLPASSMPLATYNVVKTLAGSIQATNTNLGVDPKFVTPGSNFRLQNASPAVNSGAPTQAAGFPSQDLDAGTRIFGSHIDRGAYESAVDDLNDFTVTTSADNGSNASPTVNSLRWAIKQANANAGTSHIKFALGSCPTLLNVNTAALPAIATDVTIDGYTQAGASRNTSDEAFDANLCVALNGTGTIATGLRTTGSGRLTARGLMFAGFTDAAISLESGSGHFINGNQFGGIAFTAANNDGVHVTANAGTALIGGFDDAGAVNLFAGNSGAAVSIDSSAGGVVVANNQIGTQPDGHNAAGNGNGVAIYNSPGNFVQYNAIANSSGNGVTIGGAAASGNTVQYNDIGLGPAGFCGGNAGAGVLVNFAAQDNLIGASAAGSGGGNNISCNGGAGVWVSGTGGGGNRTTANLVQMNQGLAIDLGAPGATANDVFDADGGPNALQNYPVTLNAFITAQAQWLEGTLGSFPNDAFRLDFYYSPQCGARGAGGQYLGRGSTATDASGQVHFWVKLPPVGQGWTPRYISATATATNGDTSEIGTCVLQSTDMLFRDTFE